jgi:hypothetical protein
MNSRFDTVSSAGKRMKQIEGNPAETGIYVSRIENSVIDWAGFLAENDLAMRPEME